MLNCPKYLRDPALLIVQVSPLQLPWWAIFGYFCSGSLNYVWPQQSPLRIALREAPNSVWVLKVHSLKHDTPPPLFTTPKYPLAGQKASLTNTHVQLGIKQWRKRVIQSYTDYISGLRASVSKMAERNQVGASRLLPHTPSRKWGVIRDALKMQLSDIVHNTLNRHEF